MVANRKLFDSLRALDKHELRRVQIFVGGLLAARGEDPAPGGDRDEPRVTYRLESVTCGKSGCRSCPHGPYWYAYWREDGRLRSRYIGRDQPGSH